MSIVYLDSSALVKMYLAEDLTERDLVLHRIKSVGRVASSVIAYAEVSSALARYFHEERINEEEYAANVDIFEDEWGSTNQLGVIPTISVMARQLLKAQRGLRAMDAIHVASALWLRQQEEMTFLSFDVFLNDVARRLMPDAF
ncbi:type II toxin-antitoxin system VapC family toxin [Deinococcus frigens]|uniref:type II toxin-antitoxin system VapC family toxin n=1 Tax=Deinococcus frigens TaxID=249403 RepID=UPI00054E1085|nr:type II toxin-antitoxin system VapC family toxin [Deinococcus frigens]